MGHSQRRAGLGDGGRDLPARAVGTIMGSNPWPLIVPCHRVVASDGLRHQCLKRPAIFMIVSTIRLTNAARYFFL